MSGTLKKYWAWRGKTPVYLAADVEEREEVLRAGLERIIWMAPDGGEIQREAQRLLARLR